MSARPVQPRALVIRVVFTALAAGLTALFARFAPAAAGGEVWTWSAPYVASLDLTLALRLDALSVVFACLATGVGAVVFAYAASYQTERTAAFYVYLACFMFAMLGVVLADDLILLYGSWELTSIASFFLIGFDHEEKEEARRGAQHALLVTVLGGLCLLAGLILIGVAADTTRLSVLLTRGDVVRASPLYLPALFLVGLGAFTKSAQVPFQSWLPRAMAAPTPVSAYLHAATMVKAGIYLLLRLSPALGGTAAWTALLVGVGTVTMLVGAARALGETHLKRSLAYSTISVLGMLTALIGVGTGYALLAALAYLIAHALYKGGLFLYAGSVMHTLERQDATELSGLARAMPGTATVAALGAVSMAGLPPLIGFLSKEAIYGAALGSHAPGWVLWAWLPLAVVTNALMVAVAGALALRPLFGERRPADAEEGSVWLWLPPALLGVLAVIVGLLPDTVAPLLARAAQDVGGGEVKPSKLAFHGLTPELALSGLTVALGLALYAARGPFRRLGGRVSASLRPEPGALFERGLELLDRGATKQTHVLSSGRLRRYALVTLAGIVALLGLGLLTGRAELALRPLSDMDGADIALFALASLAALATVLARTRFAAVVAMNAVGFPVALYFFRRGAPDLAITQFVVDILSAVLFVAAFYHLPALARRSARWRQVRDAVLCLGLGGAMAWVTLACAQSSPVETVSDWMVHRAVPVGHGHNVVNIILTDFRAIDTLGEIAVLGSAALGIAAMLRLRPTEQEAP